MARDLDALLQPGETLVYRAPGPSRWKGIFWLTVIIGVLAGVAFAAGLEIKEYAPYAVPALVLGFWTSMRSGRVETVLTDRRIVQTSGGRNADITEIPLDEVTGIRRMSGYLSLSRRSDEDIPLLGLRDPWNFANALATTRKLRPPPPVGRLENVSNFAGLVGGLPGGVGLAWAGYVFLADSPDGIVWAVAQILPAFVVGLLVGLHVVAWITMIALRPLVTREEMQNWLITETDGEFSRKLDQAIQRIFDPPLTFRLANALYGHRFHNHDADPARPTTADRHVATRMTATDKHIAAQALRHSEQRALGEGVVYRERRGWVPYDWPVLSVAAAFLVTPTATSGFVFEMDAKSEALYFTVLGASVLCVVAFLGWQWIQGSITRTTVTKRRILHNAGWRTPKLTDISLEEITGVEFLPALFSCRVRVHRVSGSPVDLTDLRRPQILARSLAGAAGLPPPPMIRAGAHWALMLMLLLGGILGFFGFVVGAVLLPAADLKAWATALDLGRTVITLISSVLGIFLLFLASATGVVTAMFFARPFVAAGEMGLWLSADGGDGSVRTLPRWATPPLRLLASVLYGRRIRAPEPADAL